MSEELVVDEASPGPPVVRPPYQILCLTGGGFRGLYSAAILEELEEKAGKPLAQVFDLVAGTSIGGILAIGLSAGIPAASMREAFENNGSAIFPRWHRLLGLPVFPRLGKGAFRRRYSPKGLRSTVEKILGERAQTTLESLPAPVLITAVDAIAQAPLLFRSGHSNEEFPLLDIALATSAAPTYFPEHDVAGTVSVDGGLIANAPDMLALMAAIGDGRPRSQIRMLSVGTAGENDAKTPRRATGAGFVFTGKSTFFLTLAAQERLSIMTARNALGRNYIRLDEKPSAEQAKKIGLAAAGRQAKETLRFLARHTVANAENAHAADFRLILSHNAAWVTRSKTS